MLDFLTENYLLLLNLLTASVAVGWAIAKVTPNKTDDQIMGFADKAVDVLQRLFSTGK